MIENIPYGPANHPLTSILHDVTKPGTFFVDGRVEIPVPRIQVADLPPLSFPIPDTRARDIVSLAGKAPFGRGEDPPEEPKDWKQPADWTCGCADCKQLKAFARDPGLKTLRLSRRKDLRLHPHRIVDENGLDMSHQTERKGSPYTLVFTRRRTACTRRLQYFKEDKSRFKRLIRYARDLDGVSEALLRRVEVASK